MGDLDVVMNQVKKEIKSSEKCEGMDKKTTKRTLNQLMER